MARVFVSYRSSDSVLAERLADELRRRGHEIWLDTWAIGVGDSIVQRIDEGLAEAVYVVLCYSDAGVSAPWTSREWMSTLARQLAGARIKLLPVRLAGGAPPAILADIRFADLAADWQNGVDELCASII